MSRVIDCERCATLLADYHCAVSRFLASCGNDTDNFIGGEEELRLREAWASAEKYFSTPME